MGSDDSDDSDYSFASRFSPLLFSSCCSLVLDYLILLRRFRSISHPWIVIYVELCTQEFNLARSPQTLMWQGSVWGIFFGRNLHCHWGFKSHPGPYCTVYAGLPSSYSSYLFLWRSIVSLLGTCIHFHHLRIISPYCNSNVSTHFVSRYTHCQIARPSNRDTHYRYDLSPSTARTLHLSP